MNNKSVLLLCAAICLFLFGCVKAPDNLDRQTYGPSANPPAQNSPTGNSAEEEEGTSPESGETATAECGDLNAIRSQLEADLQKSYKNIKILNARIGAGQFMPTYDIEIGSNEDFTLDKVVNLLYSDRVDAIINITGFYILPVFRIVDVIHPVGIQ